MHEGAEGHLHITITKLVSARKHQLKLVDSVPRLQEMEHHSGEQCIVGGMIVARCSQLPTLASNMLKTQMYWNTL